MKTHKQETMSGQLRKIFLSFVIIALVKFLFPLTYTRHKGYENSRYQEIQSRLISGWNTWDSRNVLSQVFLPEGFSLNLAFKQVYWLEEKYLPTALIGRRGEGVEHIRPGLHAFDGSYTQLEIEWEKLKASVETAAEGEDLVILVTPLEQFSAPVKMVVESGMLWNRPGTLARNGNILTADLPQRTIRIFCTSSPLEDPYVQTRTPYLVVFLNQPTGVSTGTPRTVEEIRQIIDRHKTDVLKKADFYGELADAFLAVQSGIAWNTIYEPRLNRVISTVGRLWNEEYGGFCTFGWDNFFLAYMTSLFSRDLAFANVIEHLRGKTEEGFIPNDNRGNGSKSWDRSQPPVGSLMVKEIYKKYPERWFLEATFDDLLGWNRWWMKKRLNEGLLSYGSHEAQNPFHEPNVRTKKTAGYESGMDDSPMYQGVPFNREKNTLELQDVGLNCLYIADCETLLEMARILGRKKEEQELRERAAALKKAMERLWDESSGFYQNKRTDTGEFSRRLSPTLFYPLLARLPGKSRAQKMIEQHFFNPEEFYGEFMLPSVARNDPEFPKQRYWKGAVWPPLNFLTYLGLRNYNLERARKELSEKSLSLFLKEWKRNGYVSENYSSISGTGDDERLSSDQFHSWGALMGFISFIEKGYMPSPERSLSPHSDGRS